MNVPATDTACTYCEGNECKDEGDPETGSAPMDCDHCLSTGRGSVQQVMKAHFQALAQAIPGALAFKAAHEKFTGLMRAMLADLIPGGAVVVDGLAMRELRLELDKLGEQIQDAGAAVADEVADGDDPGSLGEVSSELTTAGSRLRAIAGVCDTCKGDGIDGDGEGMWKCEACDGAGVIGRFPPPSSEEIRDQQDKDAAEYAAWLETPEGQAAMAEAFTPTQEPQA